MFHLLLIEWPIAKSRVPYELIRKHLKFLMNIRINSVILTFISLATFRILQKKGLESDLESRVAPKRSMRLKNENERKKERTGKKRL